MALSIVLIVKRLNLVSLKSFSNTNGLAYIMKCLIDLETTNKYYKLYSTLLLIGVC